MNERIKKPLHQIGYDFIPEAHLPAGKDEFYLRDQQLDPKQPFRALTAYEIERLVKNENHADNWNDITVREQFDPRLVKSCQFYGRIRIGALEPYFLEYHELKLPVGLYNSTIVSCDIGDNVVIKNVDHLAHYIIGDEVILFNINEMHCTAHAKFGNGVLKEGEPESVRIWLEICNENGGRKVMPFNGMTTADAWLWAKYRDDQLLMEKLQAMTEAQFDALWGYYGVIGERTVIKNTRILKDVKVGSYAYIKGANKLKNITVNSSAKSPCQIGEGVEMVNGIVGYGSRAFYGVKAVRFVMGENTTLKYGARLINSFLGDNSTISCCEVLNSLIFPAHEQHHNNSFLVAATIMGQSNIAAGATLGSNHNSRGADGEMVAGRGFWPGLCVDIKYNARFASFCLLTKGSYPNELQIPFPFCLIGQDTQDNALVLMPAYWWLYNMYALARNAWKFGVRDRRQHSQQPIVFDFLAPDTINEIFLALKLLERFTAKAYLEKHPATELDRSTLGESLLMGDPKNIANLTVLGENIENSKRPVRILKAQAAYQAYREMLHYYCLKSLLSYAEANDIRTWTDMDTRFSGATRKEWINAGGQLMPQTEIFALQQDIKQGSIQSWRSVHQRYQFIYDHYPAKNAAHAFASLLELYKISGAEVTPQIWNHWLEKAAQVGHLIATRTRNSREKDHTNTFRKITFDNPAEMEAVIGHFNDNSFVRQMEELAQAFEKKCQQFRL